MGLLGRARVRWSRRSRTPISPPLQLTATAPLPRPPYESPSYCLCHCPRRLSRAGAPLQLSHYFALRCLPGLRRGHGTNLAASWRLSWGVHIGVDRSDGIAGGDNVYFARGLLHRQERRGPRPPNEGGGDSRRNTAHQSSLPPGKIPQQLRGACLHGCSASYGRCGHAASSRRGPHLPRLGSTLTLPVPGTARDGDDGRNGPLVRDVPISSWGFRQRPVVLSLGFRHKSAAGDWAPAARSVWP